MTPFELMQRHVGIKEISERGKDHPFIQWCFECVGMGLETADETPWCSAVLNRICWMLRLPRSKSASARSWLMVGQHIELDEAQVGYDVVILKRGTGDQPGPEVIAAPGHVGLFAGLQGSRVYLLGGNQPDICVAPFDSNRVLGVRRLS